MLPGPWENLLLLILVNLPADARFLGGGECHGLSLRVDRACEVLSFVL